MYALILVLVLFQELKCLFFCYQFFSVDELISTPKVITFLPVSLPIEKDGSLSNPIPYPEYSNLSICAFLVKLTDPNKQFFNAG